MTARRRRSPTATHWGAFDAVIEDGQVERLVAPDNDPDPPPAGFGVPARSDDPSRLVTPMARRGWLEHGPRRDAGGRGSEPFVEITWEQAFDLAARAISDVRAARGNDAIYGGSYGWASAGRFHHAQSQIHRFLACAGGYVGSIGTYSTAAMEAILPHVIGGARWSIWERGPCWGEIAEHGELVVCFGGMAPKNGLVNPGGMGRHEVAELQRRCRARGVEFVNVSPVRDDTAPWLDAQWVPVRPNTDVALMLGIAHTLLVEGRHDGDFLARCCTGFDRFADYLIGATDGVPKDPAWAGQITGIEPETVVELARRISERRTVVNASWSIQRQEHGEQSHWMAATLAAMSGSLGQPGGGFAAGLGIATVGVRAGRHAVASFPRPENLVETAIPVARVADMLLDPGGPYEFNGGSFTYPDIRLVYWAGGNPFHHHQDLNRLVRAWQRPETVIVHEAWWTPLARHADLVLPVATALERNDISAGLNDTALLAMYKATEPPARVRTDYEVFAAIATRLGCEHAFTEGRSADAWVRALYERTALQLRSEGIELPGFETFWARGRAKLPELPASGVGSFAALRADPDHYPLATPSGRIEIFSKTIDGFGYHDCPGHPTWLEPTEWTGAALVARLPLQLISNQPRNRLHSQHDNGPLSRAAKIAGREAVLIHPRDAETRGIADGDVVRIFNDRGACLAGAKLHEGLRLGVVVLATGAWFDPLEPGEPGSLDLHGNPNVLTHDRGTSRLAQGPAANALVDMERVRGPVPAVRAFDAPPGVPADRS